MLKSLSIDNYALIDYLDFNLTKGFVVITGETGAGKSIIMGALGLILGNRAEINSLKNPDKKCLIEGVFDIQGLNLESFFEEEELDYEETCLIRREITPTGKSRSFINDTPVTIKQLKKIAELLIDVHSQHQNLLIRDKNYYLTLLDVWADNVDLLANYQHSYEQQKQCRIQLHAKKEELTQKMKDRDYLAFQWSQLDEAKLNESDQLELEEELQELSHAEEIKLALSNAEKVLLSEDIGGQFCIQEAKTHIHKIAALGTKYGTIEERLNSLYIELQDLSSEIERINESLLFDSNHFNWINERLNLIYSLEKKHQVNTIPELIALRDRFEQQLSELDDSDVIIDQLEKEYLALKNQTDELASLLSQKRLLVIPEIEQAIIVLLNELGMKDVQLSIVLTAETEFSSHGKDDVKMLFSANKGSQMNRVEDIASGGEIARLLLSIKAVLAKKRNLSSIIFDEIDTGVSGEIAHRMAAIMTEMSHTMQVICITHLPQISARGTTHYKVYKKVENNGTHTDIKLLQPSERVDEIAYMLSGEQLTPASLNNARELLNGLDRI